MNKDQSPRIKSWSMDRAKDEKNISGQGHKNGSLAFRNTGIQLRRKDPKSSLLRIKTYEVVKLYSFDCLTNKF